MRILVTGASGFAGSLLVPRLLRDGHAVRALGREPARVAAALADIPSDGPTDLVPEVEIFQGDALSGEGLARAVAGVDVAYYLIHSMEPSPTDDSSSFDERDRIAAHNFADASARAGVARIVYL